MKLTDFKDFSREFEVSGLHFKMITVEYGNLKFSIHDAGGLLQGYFVATFDDPNGNIHVVDSPGHKDTVELMRKTGESNLIAHNIKKIIQAI